VDFLNELHRTIMRESSDDSIAMDYLTPASCPLA
jgi:hypothetical protein